MKRIALILFLSLPTAAALAQVTVTEAWVRGTVPQQKATGVFMQLHAEKDVRLVAVKSPVAGVAEIHEMTMTHDVMKMRALPNGLDLPAGKNVELKPGGYHVMLLDLKQQMKEGDVVPVTLIIEGKDKKQTTLEVRAPVRALGANGNMGAMHKH